MNRLGVDGLEKGNELSCDPLLVAFDTSIHPMWIYESESLCFVRVNDSALARYGYSRDEFLNLTVSDLHVDAAVKDSGQFINERRGDVTQVCIRQNRTRGGRLIDVDLVSIGLGGGLVLTIPRDVSDLVEATRTRELLLDSERRARAEAERERARFRAVLEGGPGLLLVIEPSKYRIIEVSDAYLRATMTRRDDIVGELLFDVFPDDAHDPAATGTRNLRASLERVVKRRRVDAMALQRYPVQRPESAGGGFEERFWSVINAPVLDEAGVVALIIHRVEDVTAYVNTLKADGADFDPGAVDRSALTMAAEVLARANEVQELNRQLEASDRLLAIAGHVARLGGWTVDLHSGRVEWSDEVCALHDMPPGTSVPLDRAIDYYVPAFRPIIREHFQQCATFGTPYDLELELQSAKGRRMWVRAIGEPVRDEHGQIVRIQGAFQDISAWKASQAEVTHLANRLSSALDSMTDAFFTLDQEWRFAYLNRQAEVLLQRSRRGLLGKVVWDEFPEARDDVFQAEYERAVETQQPASFEAFFAPLSSWFNVRAYPSADGLAVYFRDVTGERAAQDRLLEQASLLDQASDAIVVRKLDGTVTYCNRGAERLYGLQSEHKFAGAAASELGYGPLLSVSVKDQVLKHGEWVGEAEQKRVDGSTITVQSHLTLVRDKEGTPSHILAINTDITEQKKLQSQLLRAQRLESIGILAGGIAHDLNNVLTPISLAITILQEESTDADTRELLSSLEASAKRGTALVRQVLGFARGLDGICVNIDLERLVLEVARIAKETFPKNIVLRTQVPNDLWPLRGDPTQVHQVLLNLCVNARDALPHGGVLTVSATNVEIDETYAAMTPALSPGPHVRIVVEDTGVGIPRAIVDRIFDPFFTTKPVGEGSGLGLSTVASIVRGFEGSVSVYSEPGHGTSFRIYLPSRTSVDEEDSTESAPEFAELRRGNGELILVVDDEESIRAITRETLTRFGYRVLTAVDGADALATYVGCGTEIDLVLTDMRMPIMDGLATVHALRRLDPSVRIIAASGLDAGWTQSRSVDGDVQRFLEKPYSATGLLTAIHDVLKQPRRQSSQEVNEVSVNAG